MSTPDHRPQDAPDISEPPDHRPTASRDAIDRARTDGGIRVLLVQAMWLRDDMPTTAAQFGGYVYEIADRLAALAVPEIERQVRWRVAAEILAAAPEREESLAHHRQAQQDARIARGESR